MQIKTWDFFATIIYLIGTSITSIEILAINVIGIDSGIWYLQLFLSLCLSVCGNLLHYVVHSDNVVCRQL